MTPTGWLALAGVAALAGSAARTPARVSSLARTGRLVPPVTPGHRRALRIPAAATGAVLASAVVLVGVSGGVALGVAAAAVAGAGWHGIAAFCRGRLDSRARESLALGLQALIAELEAGGRPPDALSAAAEVGTVYAAVFARAARTAAAGGDAGEVLAGAPATQALGCAWSLGERTGAALTGVLGRVAADLDAAAEHRRAVAVALAGPRSSAALLTGLPLLGIALGNAMGANPLRFLLGPRAGSVTCCVGVLLDVGGVLWMQRILRRAEDG